MRWAQRWVQEGLLWKQCNTASLLHRSASIAALRSDQCGKKIKMLKLTYVRWIKHAHASENHHFWVIDVSPNNILWIQMTSSVEAKLGWKVTWGYKCRKRGRSSQVIDKRRFKASAWLRKISSSYSAIGALGSVILALVWNFNSWKKMLGSSTLDKQCWTWVTKY